MVELSLRRKIPCALCGPGTEYRVLYPERLQESTIDFVARKTPIRQHFRVVECRGCGLIYSTPILSSETIYRLYQHCSFLHEGQLGNMLRDYRNQLRHVVSLLPAKGRLLEIGCANGFFLEAALELGFDDVCGVEPSEDAVRKAPPHIRPKIINSIFSPDLLPKGSFDIVCCFQVLDHLLDPKEVLLGAQALLREGGVLLLINHNIRSWLPRLLGEGCPMYDIEHIYLFDRKTAAQLLETTGYEVVRVANIPNSYTLSYATKMFPLPGLLKRSLIALLDRIGLSASCVRLPAGNMVSVGRKRRQVSWSLRSTAPVFVNNAVGCA